MMLTTGFRAAPRLMTMGMFWAFVSGIFGGFSPIAVKVFVDGMVTREHDKLVWGAVLMTTTMVGTWVPMFLMSGANQQRILAGVRVYVSMRIAELTTGTPGIEHFERPEYLRELDLLNDNAWT